MRGLSGALRPFTLMTQMRCLFFQIVMSLMKRRTVKQSILQLIMYLPLVGHLQMKGPWIWKHKPCRHQLPLMVTLVSPTFPVYSSQRQYVFLICANVPSIDGMGSDATTPSNNAHLHGSGVYLASGLSCLTTIVSIFLRCCWSF